MQNLYFNRIMIYSDIESNLSKILDRDPKTRKYQYFYKKWIKSYLSSANDANENANNKTFASNFINRLSTSIHTPLQRAQATHSIELFFKNFSEKPFVKSSITDEIPIKPSVSWANAENKLKNEIRIRHYSPKTLKSYMGWFRKFYRYIHIENINLITSSDVKKYLTYLADQNVSPSTQNQAFNALLFLFNQVLNRKLEDLKDTPRARRRKHIPTVLSKEELFEIMIHLSYPENLFVKLAYGCGLRLSEGLNLRVQDVDFSTGLIKKY